MAITAAPLTMKPPRLDGFSVPLMESHYENNYGGAVRRLNAIDARLKTMDFAKASGFDINGLKREQLITAGSVILHEIYFDSLGGPGGDPEDEVLAAALIRNFGSLEAWRGEFVAMAGALGGGSGWVLLCWSARLGRLVNQSVGDHAQALAGAVPILVLDMYEHAYHMDFGADAGSYIDAFMRNINWTAVAARFHGVLGKAPRESPAREMQALPALSVDRLNEALNHPETAPMVLDVRLPADRLRDRLPGAAWRNMREVDDWADHLPRDRRIVVYCMHGAWVSQDTAAALRGKGLDARNLEGGISAWCAMGLPTEPLDTVAE